MRTRKSATHITIWSAHHPIWPVLQSAISVIGLLVLAAHGLDGNHQGGLDKTDVFGATGGAFGIHLTAQLVRKLWT